MFKGLRHQFSISLTLYFRNRMAMLYGYLFPSIFLLAFWVLYRYERVPLVRHMGELLTVTILGGACFGLATTLVSERERGVWRRFKLTPVPAGILVLSTLAARYVLLVTAGLLQLGLAMALGMPLPNHPVDLLIAFTIASFSFLGLGLVIAMLADNVPAVQALGQCIFLPMLIIGGVAVPLTTLPGWALHLSAFFPGRYAVEVIQASVAGDGLANAGFSILALSMIGAAACVAGGGLFRWDAQQRFATRHGKGWLGVAFAGWIAAGLLAEWQGRVIPQEMSAARYTAPANVATGTAAPTATAPITPAAPATEESAGTPPVTPAPERPVTEAPSAASSSESQATNGPAAARSSTPATPPAARAETSEAVPPQPAAPAPPPPSAPATATPAASAPWRGVTMAQIKADLVFERLPPDSGVVTPIASVGQEADPGVSEELDILYGELANWAPGKTPDPLERVRNLLFVAATVDVFQEPTEAFVPLLVFDQIEQSVPREDLIKILYWIAVHPDEGSDAAASQMQALGIGNRPADMMEVRGRTGVYAVKLLGRLTGDRPAR